MEPVPFRARETVARETPTASAMSLMVVGARLTVSPFVALLDDTRRVDGDGRCELLTVCRCRMDRSNHLHADADPTEGGESVAVRIPRSTVVQLWLVA
jgi:hypothetical protein